MKRFFPGVVIFLVLFNFPPLRVWGQIWSEIDLGVKAGVDLAGFYSGDAEDWDSKLGFTGGVFLRRELSETFTLQPELLYTMRGAEYKGEVEEAGGRDLEVTLEIDYIEVPILVKYLVPVGEVHILDGVFREGVTLRPHVFAGPSLGIKIRDKVKVESGGASTSADIGDITGVSSVDLGVVLGADVDLEIGDLNFVLDIRYTPGLTTTFSKGDEKNSVWSFALGYVF